MDGTPNVDEAATQSSRPPFVVGVGASAGGLEALQRLFEKTKPTGALAFVVIQRASIATS